jgi:iron complex outermembrane recepter protein
LGDTIRINSLGQTETVRAPQRNYGVEAELEWQASSNWKLGSAITWQEGENDAANNGNFRPLSSIVVPPLKLSFYAENQTTPTWSNRLQLLSIGGRSRAFDNGVEPFTIEPYLTFDLISKLKVGGGNLEFGIENLLNSQYLPVSSQERTGATESRRFAASGRTLSLRYSLDF